MLGIFFVLFFLALRNAFFFLFHVGHDRNEAVTKVVSNQEENDVTNAVSQEQEIENSAGR